MGRTNIGRQPPVTASESSFKWLELLFSTMLSQVEHALNKSNAQTSLKTPLLQYKETVALLCLALIGHHPKARRKNIHIFRLTEDGDCDTLIFANALRHDLNVGTVFLDAFLVPITTARLDNRPFQKALEATHKHIGATMGLAVSKEEMVLWKRLFPAIAERCRTWNHTSECEYKTGTIPLSTAHGEMSICSCGNGKDAQHMPAELDNFAKYATRIAIPLLSAVPYVEPMMPELPSRNNESELRGASAQRSSARGASARVTTSHSPGRIIGEVGDAEDACGHCGTVKTGLKACARCRKVKYCNHACQKAAWKAHKKECGK
ncbi:hypothetical protein H2203_005330 [Taxawa tesnikishii (nom. ined.)]|nr:hypothetical protein H2203_005330 [Dothideales sp. JES 119]